MKKILYVHGNSNIIGGIETFIEVALFSHKKFQPHIIFINDGILPRRIKDKGFENIITLNGGRLRYLHKTLWSILQVARYIKRNKIDVVMGQGFHAWIYAGLAAKITGIKGVFYCHDVITQSKIGPLNPIDFIASRIKPSIAFGVSVKSKESLEKYMKGNNVHILYEGIDLEKYKPGIDFSKTKREFKLGDNNKIVTMIGRIQEWKGQEYFIKAIPYVLSEFPETHFLVVGEPTFKQDDAYFDKIKDAVRILNIQNRVTFTGFRENIPEIIAASDIIVHASIEHEPQSLVIREAMSMEKPVIATNIGGHLDYAVDGINLLLIPSKDEKALSGAIIKLLKDPELRFRIGKEARETVVRRFSIDTCIEKMERIMEEVL